MKSDDAITYAQRHTLHVLLIERPEVAALVRSGQDWDIDRPHPLYSGTKSFWGIAAAAAWDDGLLDLDEPVAQTIREWQRTSPKRTMTIRQLLNLTSGYGFGGLGNAVPTAARALDIPLKDEPGSKFTYGGVPLQIFGEILRRKVAPRFNSAHAYLQARVLDPIGMRIANWRTLRDGTRPLPTGAFASASEWLKFGRLLLRRGDGVIGPAAFAECTTGTSLNPAYGLGLWLKPGDAGDTALYASGAGGQGLYILPRLGIVAVHFAQTTSWDHSAFMKRLAALGAP